MKIIALLLMVVMLCSSVMAVDSQMLGNQYGRNIYGIFNITNINASNGFFSNVTATNFFGTFVGNVTVPYQSSAAGWANTSTTTSTSLNVNVDSGTLFINSTSNNVGIGTTTPTYRLELSSGASDDVFKMASTRNIATQAQMLVYANKGTNSANNDRALIVFNHDKNDNSGTMSAAIGSKVFSATSSTGLGLGFSTGTTSSDDMVIDNNGNVGIGTSSPQTKLHLSSTSGSPTALRIEASGSGGESSIELNANGNNWSILSDDSSDLLRIFQDTTAVFAIDSSREVGIGTVTPSSKLEVIDTSTTSIIRASYDGSRYLDLSPYGVVSQFGSTNNNMVIGINSSGTLGNLYFNTANSTSAYATRMAIRADGNVGIGTTTPPYKLSIVGSQWMSGASGSTTLLMDNSSSSTNVLLNSQGSSYFRGGDVGVGVTSPVTRLDIGGSGGANGVRLGQDTQSTGLSQRLFFENATSGMGYSILKNGGVLQFSTGSTAGSATGTSRMVMTDAGLIGINTSSPASALDVSGTTSVDTLSISTGVVQSAGDYNFASATARMLLGTSGGTPSLFFGAVNTNDWYIQSLANKNLVIVQNGVSTAMVFENSTNFIGIGIPDPIGRLHLNSTGTTNPFNRDIIISGSLSSIGASRGIAFTNANVNNAMGYIGMTTDPSGNQGELFFATATSTTVNATERVRIDNSGNVGIGTSTPAHPLDVQGVTRINSTLILASGITDSGTISMGAADLVLNGTGGTYTFWGYNGGYAPIISMDDNQRLGIATTTPAEALHVVGNSYVTGTTYIGDGQSIGSYSGNNGSIRISTTLGLGIRYGSGTVGTVWHPGNGNMLIGGTDLTQAALNTLTLSSANAEQGLTITRKVANNFNQIGTLDFKSGVGGTVQGAKISAQGTALWNASNTNQSATSLGFFVQNNNATNDAMQYPALMIDKDGDVNIGGRRNLQNDNIGYRLEVNGTMKADDYYSGDGTIGFTGTCAAATTLTVKDGLITGCS